MFEDRPSGNTPADGIVISLILIAVGAILTWAVNASSSSIDVDVVGVVLMIVGLVVFMISLVLLRTWWGVGSGPGGVREGALLGQHSSLP